MKYIKLITYCILFSVFCSCSPNLNFFEIEERINNKNTAHFEGDIKQMMKNIPVKSLKKNGAERYMKRFKSVFNGKRKYPVKYSEIGELDVKGEGKCNSYFYYNATYLVTKSQKTPYIDSTALKLNYKNYGKENVTFNPNSKILHVTDRKHVMLVFDKDRNWKILTYNKQSLNENYGKGFWDCTQSKDNNTD